MTKNNKPSGERPAYEDILNAQEWLIGVKQLTWMSSKYGGATLKGACPACTHVDGINVFVPTVWVKDGGVSLSSDIYSRSAVDEAGHIKLDAVLRDLLSEQPRENLGREVSKMAKKRKGKNRSPVINFEAVICQCSLTHIGTPEGKSGCGRWGYIEVPIMNRLMP